MTGTYYSSTVCTCPSPSRGKFPVDGDLAARPRQGQEAPVAPRRRRLGCRQAKRRLPRRPLAAAWRDARGRARAHARARAVCARSNRHSGSLTRSAPRTATRGGGDGSGARSCLPEQPAQLPRQLALTVSSTGISRPQAPAPAAVALASGLGGKEAPRTEGVAASRNARCPCARRGRQSLPLPAPSGGTDRRPCASHLPGGLDRGSYSRSRSGYGRLAARPGRRPRPAAARPGRPARQRHGPRGTSSLPPAYWLARHAGATTRAGPCPSKEHVVTGGDR